MRPDWDTIWIDFAKNISRRSYDPQFQVGCCIVSQDNCQVLSIGYNGNHSGGPNERESTQPGHSGFIHAEINAGIHKVVYLYTYRDTSGLELLKDNGIEVFELKD